MSAKKLSLHGRVSLPDLALGSKSARQDATPTPEVRAVVFVCHGPSCTERGSPELCKQLRARLNESSARRSVRVCETTCLDHCATGPNALMSHERAIEACLTAAGIDDMVACLSAVSAPGAGGGASADCAAGVDSGIGTGSGDGSASEAGTASGTGTVPGVGTPGDPARLD